MQTQKDVEEIARIVVDCAYRLHVDIGPGLLESVYQAVEKPRFFRTTRFEGEFSLSDA